MPGGIVQLAVYGTQDLFLTGTPQVTFFKIVYRRYTNFAIESIAQELLGSNNFGNEVTCLVDKIGDLMYKVYLEIDIPRVLLAKNPTNYTLDESTAQIQFEQIQEYYQLVFNYTSTNTDITRKLDLLCRTNNIPMSDIVTIMNDPDFIGALVQQRTNLQEYIATNPNFDAILELRDLKLDLIQEINRVDIQIRFNSIVTLIDDFYVTSTSDEKDVLKRRQILNMINNILYDAIKHFYMSAYTVLFEKQNVYNSFLDGTYKESYGFAWVEELGHAVIDQLDIKIGNQTMDRHTGDWMILYNRLFKNEYQAKNYDIMIGNVPELYTFDNKPKDTYTLLIPLQFWFCRHNGLALPLVALRYHDVLFTLRYKDLARLCYVEDDPALLDIPNIQAKYGINMIDAKLYIDYIYLDSDERRRFAQSTHEYLIEIVQYAEITDVNGTQTNIHLDFNHPTKFVIWFAQPNQYRQNPTGRNKCQWNNFGINPDKTGYTMDQSYLRLNSYNRTDKNHDIKFYNYVQPYLYFAHSPTDGINVYSFSVKPMILQPSSTCNLSRIDDFGIVINFSNDFVKIVNSNVINDIPDGIYIGVYVYSYNIIRVLSGLAGLAFQTST
jgi:Large eukaryotic DNA virus major capsid protein/Major capsid protein N-terminus